MLFIGILDELKHCLYQCYWKTLKIATVEMNLVQ